MCRQCRQCWLEGHACCALWPLGSQHTFSSSRLRQSAQCDSYRLIWLDCLRFWPRRSSCIELSCVGQCDTGFTLVAMFVSVPLIVDSAMIATIVTTTTSLVKDKGITGGGLWSGIWCEPPFARLHTITPWPQDLFIHKSSQLPGERTTRLPFPAHGTTQAHKPFTVLPGTHCTSASKKCTCGQSACLGAQRRSIIQLSRGSNPQSLACKSRALPLSPDGPPPRNHRHIHGTRRHVHSNHSHVHGNHFQLLCETKLQLLTTYTYNYITIQ